MSNRKDYPVNFTPRGLCDAWDATAVFPGACLSLQNLIFDQSNPEQVVSRPGVGTPLTSFSGFTAPTFISSQISIGNQIYGMVSTGRNAGQDEPFSYNVATGLFTTIANVTVGNTPTSQSTAGDWTPPTMAVIGAQIIITHPGYSGGAKSGSFTGAITGNQLTISGGVTGTVAIGSNITGATVPAGTAITGFMSGVFGGNGVYTLNNTVGAPIGAEAMSSSSGNYFGVINIANPTAPYYYATNTGVFGLPSVPTSVSNFNNRAYFSCANMLYYSDVLLPTNMATAGQALTIGDTTPITAQSGLPVQTATAGIVSALIVFKGFQIWQIIGDAAVAGSLSLNFLSLNIGCTAPRSIVQTPAGTIFISVDGPFYVSAVGQVLPLTKDATKLVQDLQAPFQNIVYPTRAAAYYSGSVYRVSLQTVINGFTGWADYWFDVTVRRWSGPHTFAYDTISAVGNYFVISGIGSGAALFASQYLPNTSSVYTDNGTNITCILQSSLFPKTQNINMKEVIESTIELSSLAVSSAYQITAVDEQFNTINSVYISLTSSRVVWGGGWNWGDGTIYNAGTSIPFTNTIPWTLPIIFKKMGLMVVSQSSNQLTIGAFFAKYRDLGYTNTQ